MRDTEQVLTEPHRCTAVIAVSSEGQAFGFAEATVRRDYVNGCHTTPVLFLEGIYVIPSARRQGIAKALCASVEQWGRSHACTEFASDALIDNVDARALHRALGFDETERVVFFRKRA